MQAKHSLDKLFETLLTDLLKKKPADPLQFIIDSLSMGPEHAAQARWQCVWSPAQLVEVASLPTGTMQTVTVFQQLAGCKCDHAAAVVIGGNNHAARSPSASTFPDMYCGAPQDAETGLPQHRKEKLLKVFKIIDKVTAHCELWHRLAG